VLCNELATYLAAAGLGLTPGGNLFEVPFPEFAPDIAVSLVDPESGEVIGSFGASLSAYDVEIPDLVVMIRGARDGLEAARTKAQEVYKKLRRLGPANLSGVEYLDVEAKPPHLAGYDANERPVFSFSCKVFKAESP
jgi:hypothetical protein